MSRNDQFPFEDEVWQVKGRYLGPDDITLPFQPEYPTLGVGFVLTLGLALLFYVAGFNPAFGAAAGIVLTGVVMKRVDADKPVLKVLATEFREAVHGHRPATKTTTVHVRTGAIRVHHGESTR